VLCALLPHAATTACRWLLLWNLVFVVKSCGTVTIFLDHVLLYCLFDMNLSRLLKHVLLFHL